MLPPDLTVNIGNDTSVYIKVALTEVSKAMAIAAVLVMLVIYLFLGTMRAAIIPAVTAPISLVATAIILWPAHFSINILTLLAMVLAIGLVVDDAIIMLENIHRRMKLGEPALLAAFRGSRQVAMAVVSTTMVLAAAFTPVALMKGAVGSLFMEFAVSLAIAVLFSMFISLTLTPVMCSKILTRKLDTSYIARKAEAAFERLKSAYHRALTARSIIHAWSLALSSSWSRPPGCSSSFCPRNSRPVKTAAFSKFRSGAPEGATSEYTDRSIRQVGDLLRPYVEKGEVRQNGRDDPRRKHQQRPGGRILVAVGSARTARQARSWRGSTQAGGHHRRPSGDYVSRWFGPRRRRLRRCRIRRYRGPRTDDLRKWRDAMMEGLSGNPKFPQVRTNFVETKPQVRIRIDRVRAADLGVSINAIGQTLQAMLGSRRATTFVDQGEEYDVLLQGALEDRRTRRMSRISMCVQRRVES